MVHSHKTFLRIVVVTLLLAGVFLSLWFYTKRSQESVVQEYTQELQPCASKPCNTNTSFPANFPVDMPVDPKPLQVLKSYGGEIQAEPIFTSTKGEPAKTPEPRHTQSVYSYITKTDSTEVFNNLKKYMESKQYVVTNTVSRDIKTFYGTKQTPEYKEIMNVSINSQDKTGVVVTVSITTSYPSKDTETKTQ
jgi:hypothetical protein